MAPTLVTSCAFGGALPLARRRGALRLRPGPSTGSGQAKAGSAALAVKDRAPTPVAACTARRTFRVVLDRLISQNTTEPNGKTQALQNTGRRRGPAGRWRR